MVNGAGVEDLRERHGTQVVGVFCGPWDTGWAARDGAVLGFEDVFRAFSLAAEAGEFELITAEVSIFRDHRRIRDFLADCDVVYANCGPGAALLYLVREREQLDVRIFREVRTVGWVGYIWQEEVAGKLERPGDQRIFPSRYARDTWEAAAPGISASRVYYPLIRGTCGNTRQVTRTGGNVGFFSAFSRDKGFASLPDVLSSMLASGHHIERLVLAGEQADPELYVSVVNKLCDIGIEVSFRGSLPNGEVRELMAQCDCILFLSVSSIESLGRVMIEASEQGVPVITADFGAARDLVSADFRIPVKYLAAGPGPCDRAFPVAQLDLQCWEPPARLSSGDCFFDAVSEYRVGAQTPTDVLFLPPAGLPTDPRPVSFSFQCHVDGLELAHSLLENPACLRAASTHGLVDLGGTLKQYLLSRGYNPLVSFQADRESLATIKESQRLVGHHPGIEPGELLQPA